MQRSFYNEDFEELIREKSDQYRMYPSERVWKGIRRSFHSSRRWYWLSFILFLTGVSYFVAEEFSSPSSVPATSEKSPAASNNNSGISAPIAQQEPSGIIPFTSVPANSHSLEANAHSNRRPAVVVNMFPENDENADGSEDLLLAERQITIQEHSGTDQSIYQESGSLTAASIPNNSEIQASWVTGNEIVDAHQGEMTAQDMRNTLEKETPRINWLQQNAMYELQMNKPGRLGWLVSFSPTMNYRKLFGNSNAPAGTDIKSVPIAGNIHGDIDHLVNHKPAVGFELGSFVTYKLNRNLTIKTGLQFNYSQYDIQAYGSNSNEVATIALNNYTGFYPDSLTSLTRIRNFGGNERRDLRNQYFQLSAPVGVELLVFGNRRIQFSVAGAIQPTYLMNRNTYLITTDFKNYTKEPSLVRRWNVNTGVEAFISYQAAGLKWQLGPQFRYQLLSSYSNKYPIKEYLMEYGVKVGISKTFR